VRHFEQPIHPGTDVALSRRTRHPFSRRRFLPTSRTFLLAALLVGLTTSAGRARAADAPVAGPGKDPGTRAERAKLQDDLNRVNVEIDALKRRPRGIRDDYRLRERMADAEAIARRLTDLDARLGPLDRATPSPDVAPEVQVSPSDDRAERDAKADILADQARRLTQEANRLEGRITALRTRNELKRRSGQLDRDPFSPLEQAKGRVGVVAVPSSSSVPKSAGEPPSFPSRNTPTGTTDTAGGAGPAPPMPVLAPSPVAAGVQDSPSSPVGQLRGVLDPASLEEVRRLEAPGAAPVNLQVMERALATLRGRAAQLSASASGLRAPAPQAP
jgi:hypothetical protein